MDFNILSNSEREAVLESIIKTEIGRVKAKFKYSEPVANNFDELVTDKIVYIRHQIDLNSNPSAFVYWSLCKHMIDHIRKFKYSVNLDSIPQSKLMNFGGIDQIEALDLLRSFLSHLNESDQLIVNCLLSGMNYKEIGTVIGASQQKAMNIIKRKREIIWKRIWNQLQ